MLFEYRYFGATEVHSGATSSGLSFAPDTRRDATFLTGNLRSKLPFRETMSALHHVVVSDLRFRARDKSEYLEWRRKQDDMEIAQIAAGRKQSAEQIALVRKELDELRAKQSKRMGPFATAKKRFFDYLYKKNIDAWFVLDPVITVHPDEVAFECFSQDESSYGRLSCSHEVFEQLGSLSYGTTNIDYSHTLYDEFQKIREDKTTSFQIDPRGFEVQTGTDEVYREEKIDLPDSWVRGFLQVGTAMGLPGGIRLKLHPLDVHNLCFFLRRHKEVNSPRSLRFVIEPDRPIRILIEPFGFWVTCPRSTHNVPDAREIRIWGRRRLLILERLLPVCRSIDVMLLGSGMPSFWMADCGDLVFTLGLSGWTANDWSASGNFDLLAPRGDVDTSTATAVMAALRSRWLATPEELQIATGFDRSTVESALVAFAQAGRTMYDLQRGVWRLRELTRDPLDMGTIRFANERESEAATLVNQHKVRVSVVSTEGGRVSLTGSVSSQNPSLTLDADQRLVAGQCSCQFFFQNKLRKGPCAHMLAIRLAFQRKVGLVEADPRNARWTPEPEAVVTAGKPQPKPAAPPPAQPRPSAQSATQPQRPHLVSVSPSISPIQRATDAARAFRLGGSNLYELQSQLARATDLLKRESPAQARALARFVTEVSRLRGVAGAMDPGGPIFPILDRLEDWLSRGAPGEEEPPRNARATPTPTPAPSIEPRHPGTALDLEAADRFVDLMIERNLLEIDGRHRAELVAWIARVLSAPGKAEAKARQLWPIFERHAAVSEFYLLDIKDLTSLLEEWG